MQSENVDVSCLIKKTSYNDHLIISGYLVDEQELIIREYPVMKSVNYHTYESEYTPLTDTNAEDVRQFFYDKKQAMKFLRQRAQKIAHRAELTLKALDAYDALVEKGLVDAK